MKPLTLEETRLKEEMKNDCFWDNIHYKNPEAEKAFNLICHLEDFEVQYWELQQENQELKDRIDKAIEYIEKDTRWFDSEYASIYGTLCTCAGAKDNRLEVMVNPSNLLEILKGGKE